jgi:hypothetical protein
VKNFRVKDSDFESATRIVKLDCDEELRRNFTDEIEQLTRLQSEIQSFDPNHREGDSSFNDFSINFFWGAAVSRCFGELVERNAELIEEVMPGHTMVVPEFFRYDPSQAIDLHTAASTVVNATPEAKYMDAVNLHVTLTDNTSLSGNPFLIWEDCDSSVETSRYCYNYLTRDGIINEDNRRTFLAAVALSESAGRTDQSTGAEFLLRRFWKQHYCVRGNVDGLYALYEPGHGVVFAPNKPHGGELLLQGGACFAKRVSASVRVLRINKKRAAQDLVRYGIDPLKWPGILSLLGISRRNRSFGLHNIDFIAALSGYTNGEELLTVLYDGQTPMFPQGCPLSVTGRRGLVSLKNLRKHHERAGRFLSTYQLNDASKRFLRNFYAADTRATA